MRLRYLAQSTVLKLYEGVRSLTRMAYRGRVGREEGTRELVFTSLPYVAVYRIKEQTIQVLRIYHGAQERS